MRRISVNHLTSWKRSHKIIHCSVQCINSRRVSNASTARFSYQIRMFSDNSDLKENIKKVKTEYEDNKDQRANDDVDPSPDRKSKSILSIVYENVKLAYSDLVGVRQVSSLKKQVVQADSYKRYKSRDGEDDDRPQYDGPTAIVAVKDQLSPWDQMKERLKNSPLIREILKGSKIVSKAAANTEIGKKAKEVTDSVRDKIEDIREVWETSQNPIIYTLSGIWDNMTGESEEAITLSAIRKLDSSFVKDTWIEEVRHDLAARVIQSHLLGNLRPMKEWLGDAVYEKLSADIRARKADGYTFDSNILEISENTVIMKLLESGSPVIVVVYMVQQISCIRNREGEIIEGSESNLRAKFYSMAFQQNYDDDTGVVMWKIVDYEFAGDVPYVF